MKKITFFIVLLVSFGVAAQGAYTFDFENSDPPNDVWTVNTGLTTTISGGDLNLALTEAASNPVFGTTTANINAELYRYVAISLKNPSAAGPTYLRMSFPKEGGGRKYISFDIPNFHSDYKTHVFDLSSESDWEYTMNDIKFHFKSAGNADYNAGAGVEINVSEIVFHEVSYSGYVQNPAFENELAAWSLDTATATEFYIAEGEGVGGSKAAEIAFDGTLSNGDIKLENSFTYEFETDIPETYTLALDYYHKATGTAAEVQVCFKLNYSDGIGGTKTFYQGWVSPGATYAVSSSNRLLDDGDIADNTYKSVTVFFRAKGGDNTTIAYLDDIVTNIKDENGDEILSIPFKIIEKPEVTLYPNPVNNVLNFTENIEKVELYNVLGQKVISKTNTNSIDVSNIEKGAYIVRIIDQNGASISQRILKK